MSFHGQNETQFTHPVVKEESLSIAIDVPKVKFLAE